MQAPTYQTNILGRGIAIAGLLLILVGVLAPIQCVNRGEECFALLQPNPEAPFFADVGWEFWVAQNSSALLLLSPIIAVSIALWSGDRFSITLSTLALSATVIFSYITIDYQASVISSRDIEIGRWFLLVGSAVLVLSPIPKSRRNNLLVSETGTQPVDLETYTDRYIADYSRPKNQVLSSRSLRITSGFVIVGVILFACGGTFAPLFCGNVFLGSSQSDCSIGGDYNLLNLEPFTTSLRLGFATNYIAMMMIALSALTVFAIINGRQIAKLVMGVATVSLSSSLFLIYYATFKLFDNDFLELSHWGWLMLLGGPSLILLGTVMTHSLTQSVQRFDEEEFDSPKQPALHSLFTLSDGETDVDEETSSDTEEI